MAADVRGYYSALGLKPGASVDAVREAFRRLAKECHPDRPGCVDGGQRFRRIAEAYEALSDATFKSGYDAAANASSPNESPPPPPPPKVEPVKCEVCGSVTAQPRRLAFWRVTGLILGATKKPVQRIFCQSCALKEEWKSTIWTGLFGWWGIPWGPLWAAWHGIENAIGGDGQQSVDEALLWQNAVAFATRGESGLAVGLGNILRKSENSATAQKAAELIQLCAARGIDSSTTLKDVWKRSVGRTFALLATLFAAPALALTVLVAWSGNGQRSPPTAPAWTIDPAAPGAPASGGDPVVATTAEAATQARPASPEATCDSPPSNGQVLVNHMLRQAEGHQLQIDNGSSGDAVIKLRDAQSGRTLATFFVAKGNKASLSHIPDGTYRIQYATGLKLAKGCRGFIKDGATASEFPDTEDLQTRYEPEVGGTNVIRSRLSYTLYPVPFGNVQPSSIDLASFDQP